MTTKPDWVPDWRDESAYEDHGDDLRAWAWEFLRRNSDYQADYAKWAALPDSEVDEKGIEYNSLKYYRTYGDWESMIYFQPVGGIQPIEGETVGDYEIRTKANVELLQIHLMKKWGLLHELPDPASDCSTDGEEELPPYFPQYVESMPGDIERPRLLSIRWPQDDDCFIETFAIDIRVNIKNQLEVIEQILEDIISAKENGINYTNEDIRRPQFHTTGFVIDLRIWDAKLADASGKEIATVLWKDEIDKAEKSALKDKNDPIGRLWKKLEQRITDSKARTNKNIIYGFREMLKWSQLPAQKRNRERKKAKISPQHHTRE